MLANVIIFDKRARNGCGTPPPDAAHPFPICHRSGDYGLAKGGFAARVTVVTGR